MLFTYQYVPHSMEKMQGFIDFIFNEVWAKAPQKGDYDALALFAPCPDLQEVIQSFHYSPLKSANFFLTGIQTIYELFRPLAPEQIHQLINWYRINNEIEKVCQNKPGFQPVCYAQIEVQFAALAEEFKKFFGGLYNQNFLGLKALREKIGNIDICYDQFMMVNNQGICPFCGINAMKGHLQNTSREAYDHYLPKAIYPFNSINFQNLAPACHECNSSYKLAKDPLFKNTHQREASNQRKSFYSYAEDSPQIDIHIEFLSPDINSLTPEQIQILFGPNQYQEELETWQDVYGIQERYKAKCLMQNDGKWWLEQIIAVKGRGGSVTPQAYLQIKYMEAEEKPFADNNFLRKPFLEACEKLGLFNQAPQAELRGSIQSESVNV
ncbi:MAG: hypothetical protein IV090_25245 [Candidatus Sericytochromatia bacterium]|nr:hypothetical protein [Candidatus Sericytochromatia bacterium]